MTEAEIQVMVLRHTNAMFTLPIDAAKNRQAHFAFWRNVTALQADMSPEDAAHFKERVHFRMDEALEGWQQAIDAIPDNDPPPAPPPTYRRQQSSYVGRTVTRAVVWNVVNSIFRAFR